MSPFHVERQALFAYAQREGGGRAPLPGAPLSGRSRKAGKKAGPLRGILAVGRKSVGRIAMPPSTNRAKARAVLAAGTKAHKGRPSGRARSPPRCEGPGRRRSGRSPSRPHSKARSATEPRQKRRPALRNRTRAIVRSIQTRRLAPLSERQRRGGRPSTAGAGTRALRRPPGHPGLASPLRASPGSVPHPLYRGGQAAPIRQAS